MRSSTDAKLECSYPGMHTLSAQHSKFWHGPWGLIWAPKVVSSIDLHAARTSAEQDEGRALKWAHSKLSKSPVPHPKLNPLGWSYQRFKTISAQFYAVHASCPPHLHHTYIELRWFYYSQKFVCTKSNLHCMPRYKLLINPTCKWQRKCAQHAKTHVVAVVKAGSSMITSKHEASCKWCKARNPGQGQLCSRQLSL